MTKEEALKAILTYEIEFSKKGVVDSLNSFRKYNEAKYFLSINGLRRQK